MKPRTEFERQVVMLNERLKPVGEKPTEWAVKNIIIPPAFRTPTFLTTCGNCGHKFRRKGKAPQGKRLYAICPHCGRRLEVIDSLKRNYEASTFFSTLERIDNVQVERVFRIWVKFKKNNGFSVTRIEVCRMWFNAKGQVAVTAKRRVPGYYLDSFSWWSDIELRGMNNILMRITDAYVYPHYSVLPELKRNGMKGSVPDCHPISLMKALLRNPKIETLMKAGNKAAVGFFVNKPSLLDKYWSAHKIAMRNGYRIKDYDMWCDLLALLERFSLDTHCVKYICPADLKAEHDRLDKKYKAILQKNRMKDELERAKKKEAEFIENKARFFGIVFADKDIEVSVLDSLEAYQAEGEAMHHCVFSSAYYNRQDSIILSAHDKYGNRIETIEFSLTENKVVQSRGVCNKNTEYHDRIVNLVNANAYRFIKARATV